MLSAQSTDKKVNEITPDLFSLAPNPEKMVDLGVQKIKKLINPNLSFIYKALPEDDPLQRKPDITKAINNLNWHPEISLDEGIKLTIDWFKKEYFK